MDMVFKSNFSKGAIGKILEKVIYKKLGSRVELDIKELKVDTDEKGRMTIHVEVNGAIERNGIRKLISNFI